MKRTLRLLAALALLVQPVRAQCQVARVTAPTPVEGDEFGTSGAIDGDWAIIGAPYNDARAFQGGAAFVFHRANGMWMETQQLLASDGGFGDAFGTTVAMSGDVVVIGAPQDATPVSVQAGSAYVFERVGSTWIERAKLWASDGAYQALFGAAVAISGDRIIIGAWNAGAWSTGEAYVFERVGATWVQVAALIASDHDQNAGFGFSVAIDGDRAIVGAPGARTSPTVQPGAAYVFERSAQGVWLEGQKLLASNGINQDGFGGLVTISGATVGVTGASAGSQPGSAYFFDEVGTTWVETQQVGVSDPTPPYPSVDLRVLRGNTALMWGLKDTDGPHFSGATYVFRRVASTWIQAEKLFASDAAASDQATPLALSGSTILVGAPGCDDACPQSPFPCNSGAAYFFEFAPTTIQYGSCASNSPCTNEDSHGGCRNSTGQGAILQASGSGSVTTDDLVMEVRHLPPFAPGLIFMGGAQTTTPFGSGQLVVADDGKGIYRIEIHFSDADGVFLHGPGNVALTQGIPNPLGHIQAGDTWNFQCWYRDQQGPCGTGFNLTNGLQVSYVP